VTPGAAPLWSSTERASVCPVPSLHHGAHLTGGMVAGASVVMVMVVPLSVGVFTLQPTTDTSPEMHLAQEWHEAGLHSWKPASDALMLVGDTGFEPVTSSVSGRSGCGENQRITLSRAGFGGVNPGLSGTVVPQLVPQPDARRPRPERPEAARPAREAPRAPAKPAP